MITQLNNLWMDSISIGPLFFCLTESADLILLFEQMKKEGWSRHQGRLTFLIIICQIVR